MKERDQLHMHKLGFPFPELLANRQTEKVGEIRTKEEEKLKGRRKMK